MTVAQIEYAKADIQNRIYSGDSPNSRRVHRSIRPLIEYSPTMLGIQDDDDEGEAVKGGPMDHGSSDDDTGDLDD